MRTSQRRKRGLLGVSLVEAVIAVGVISIAFPLVAAALAGASEIGSASQAETRSAWIVPACLEELEAARAGRSQHLPQTNPAWAVSGGEGRLALAFAADGRLIGSLESDEYERGVREKNGETVRFIASLTGDPAAEEPGRRPLLRIHIMQEHPAVAPASKRRKIHFYTLMP